jgi:hypothetical protein
MREKMCFSLGSNVFGTMSMMYDVNIPDWFVDAFTSDATNNNDGSVRAKSTSKVVD